MSSKTFIKLKISSRMYLSCMYHATRDLTLILSREWSFFTGADPTNGNVNYLSMLDATAQGLAYVDDCGNSTVLAVDSTSTVAVGGYRNS